MEQNNTIKFLPRLSKGIIIFSIMIIIGVSFVTNNISLIGLYIILLSFVFLGYWIYMVIKKEPADLNFVKKHKIGILIWTALFAIMVLNPLTPEDKKRIHQKELEEQKIEQQKEALEKQQEAKEKQDEIPKSRMSGQELPQWVIDKENELLVNYVKYRFGDSILKKPVDFKCDSRQNKNGYFISCGFIDENNELMYNSVFKVEPKGGDYQVYCLNGDACSGALEGIYPPLGHPRQSTMLTEDVVRWMTK